MCGSSTTLTTSMRLVAGLTDCVSDNIFLMILLVVTPRLCASNNDTRDDDRRHLVETKESARPVAACSCAMRRARPISRVYRIRARAGGGLSAAWGLHTRPLFVFPTASRFIFATFCACRSSTQPTPQSPPQPALSPLRPPSGFPPHPPVHCSA